MGAGGGLGEGRGEGGGLGGKGGGRRRAAADGSVGEGDAVRGGGAAGEGYYNGGSDDMGSR